MNKILVAFLIISFIGFPLASAHPFTEATDPAQASNVPAGVQQVIVYYSEAVEIDFSALKVFDGSGDQIDNKDTAYYEGEESLVVTTPPLEDGVYTVTSKVLSKVDGHLVDYAFVFAVGDVVIDPALLEQQGTSETIFFPEAGARFPGLVGQTIVLGAVIAAFFVWGSQRKDFVKEKLGELEEKFHGKLLSITGIGIILVFASNIIMLAVQTWRLETSAIDALMTNFGMTWIIRMGITIALLGAWFVLERKANHSRKAVIPVLILSLILIGTTTMISHGAASEIPTAIALDYVHNLVAAVWIGGIIFFGFILLPSLTCLDDSKKEKMSLLFIPKFSMMFVIAIGIVIISGPILLWFLESNVGLLTESTYGRLILVKIALAIGMIAFGGYYQFKVQKNAEKNLNGSITVHKKLRRSLKVEAALGVALLGVVALLANGTLPAGEIQQVSAQEVTYGYQTTAFSENAKFDIEIFPFTTGQNTISASVSDLDGNPLVDLSTIQVKISNPLRNIAPIEIQMNEILDNDGNVARHEGEATFGFSGKWQIEVEAQRTQNANENVILNEIIKPRLSELKTEIIEYDFPEAANPLYPIYDGDNTIWISDPSKPRIWKFTLDDQQFESFDFAGLTSITLAFDNDGKIWFTDTPDDNIGVFDPETEEFQIIDLPWESVPISLAADLDNNIWVSVFDKNMLLKYDPDTGEFEEHPVPTAGGGPFALLRDSEGNIWFTESAAGNIGYVIPKTGEMKLFVPDPPIASPEALYFDEEGNLWVTAHTGVELLKFNPVLETFERITVPDPEALPFDMEQDRYGNIWFAQHTVDKLAVYDPHNGNLIEVDIPTETSFVQFVTADNKDNIWFVEQQANKLGILKITEIPSLGGVPTQVKASEIKYTELVSPLISLGIIATSLFFVKAVRDKRRINSLIK